MVLLLIMECADSRLCADEIRKKEQRKQLRHCVWCLIRELRNRYGNTLFALSLAVTCLCLHTTRTDSLMIKKCTEKSSNYICQGRKFECQLQVSLKKICTCSACFSYSQTNFFIVINVVIKKLFLKFFSWQHHV